jgi:septum formation protein
MKMMIYLASQSPRRKEILRKMKIPFRVVKSRYEEKIIAKLSPKDLVLQHAVGKARHAKAPKAARWILGSDTIVYCQGKVLGKPQTERQATQMLSLLSGKSHYVYTGVALWDRKTGKIQKEACKTRVRIKKISLDQIRSYIYKVNSFDKAGAYAIQMRPKIVAKISGSYSNVMGLPKEVVRALIRRSAD